MELHADEPWMVGVLDDLGQHPIRGHAREAHAVLLKTRPVGGVDLVAVAVALGNLRGAVDMLRRAAAFQQCRIGDEPHGAAVVVVYATILRLVALDPFGTQADHRLTCYYEFTRIPPP